MQYAGTDYIDTRNYTDIPENNAHSVLSNHQPAITRQTLKIED